MRDVAVVTGAGRGIGRAVAHLLAERGCDVALLARTAEQLERSAAEVVERGARALAIRCNVANRGEVFHAAARIMKELGVPRVVVSNAGVVRRALVTDMGEDEWDEVLDVNLKGAFFVAQSFLPAMLEKKRGRVVAVASISSTLGTPRLSAYCAAKWGLVGFVKSLAEEVRGTGVQAMAVLPGSVDTEMLKGGEFQAQMPPEEVARLVAFAGLDAPDAMNGSAIEIFGP